MKRVSRRQALWMLAAEREWRAGSAAMLIDLHRQIDAGLARAEKAEAAEKDAKAALARVQAERDSLSAQLERAHDALALPRPGFMRAVAAGYHGSTEGNRP